MNTLPVWYPPVEAELKKHKLPGRNLCIRFTKWTDPVLKDLYEELKSKYFTLVTNNL